MALTGGTGGNFLTASLPVFPSFLHRLPFGEIPGRTAIGLSLSRASWRRGGRECFAQDSHKFIDGSSRSGRLGQVLGGRGVEFAKTVRPSGGA